MHISERISPDALPGDEISEVNAPPCALHDDTNYTQPTDDRRRAHHISIPPGAVVGKLAVGIDSSSPFAVWTV